MQDIEQTLSRLSEISERIESLKGNLQKCVSTQRLEITDSQMNTRAVLTVEDDGTAAIRMTDAHGVVRLSMCVCANGESNLVFHDRAGQTAASIGILEGDIPQLALFDGQHQMRVALHAGKDGSAGLSVGAEGGDDMIRLAVDKAGLPSLVMIDKYGKKVSMEP